MRRLGLAILFAPLALGGCLSFETVQRPEPAPTQTLVVPPGTTVVCANGTVPPCY